MDDGKSLLHAQKSIDTWLERALANRALDLGEPVFRPPTDDEFQAAMGVEVEEASE